MNRKTTELLKTPVVFLKAMLAAFRQSIGRLTLWLACHGISLPWSDWAEQSVSTQTLERYRRRALVARLRVQRYRIGRGPYFLRFIFERFSEISRLLQFPLLLVMKVSAALFVCLLPFIIFFLIRVYLPVPQRIGRTHATVQAQNIQTAEAVVPQVVRLQFPTVEAGAAERLGEANDGSFFSFVSIDSRSDEGLLIQGRGSAHEESRRGWRVTPASDLLFRFNPQQEQRTLRFRFRPIPTSRSPAQCKLQVMTDIGKILFATTFDTRVASRHLLLKTPLTRNLQEKLMPDFALNRAWLHSSPVALPFEPGNMHLRFRLERLDSSEDTAACSALLHGFEFMSAKKTAAASAGQNGRSLLMVLFDSFNADVALDESTMPWFAHLLKSPRTLNFTQHHATDVRTNMSLNVLLGLSNTAANPESSENMHLVERLRASGYRVVVVGSVDPAETQLNNFVPDLTVRIDNETYEPRLALSQLFNVYSEEGSAPLLVVLRLKGMSGPWRPFFSDFSLRNLFFGGNARGLMDAWIFAHLKTLNRELSHSFSEMEKIGLFKKMDLIVTAERGFDLGLNVDSREQNKPTYTNDLLLNQDTLRVPLGVVFADTPQEGLPLPLKNQNVVSSHNDLTRSLWAGLGINDARFPPEARRLWNRNDLLFSTRSRSGFGARETDIVMRMIPVRSKFQEGILFADPDSAGGFLKYVSQSIPTRISVPDAYGWPSRVSFNLQAGEQFRQVSRRGQKEEMTFRVNNRFVREARRVMRRERRFPLRLRMTAQDNQKVDLLFEEKSSGASVLLPQLPEGLRVSTSKLDSVTYIHKVSGALTKNESIDLRGSGLSFRIVENKGEGLLVACPEAFVFTPQGLTAALNQKTVCLLESPDSERISHLIDSGKKALSFWLVEDENQICKLQEDSTRQDEDYAECLESTPHSGGGS